MIKRPLPTGIYAVGTFTYTVYNDRDEVLMPGTKRSIPARVYYPVLKESVEGMSKVKYMSVGTAQSLKKNIHAPVNIKKLEKNGDNYSECYKNAPRIEGMKFPLIIFNHGLCSYREANSFLCLELASQGYVVISVSHPYDAVFAELDDGSTVSFLKVLSQKAYDPFIEGAIQVIKLTKAKGTDRELADRFEELQRKYCKQQIERIDEWEKDTLAAVKYAKENLSDLIDFDMGIAASGHSLGGATAYMLCLDYPEFVCGINIDGALFGDNKGKVLERPFVQISCKANVNAETRPYIDHTKPVYKAMFYKMQHIGFSDMKHTIPKIFTGGLDADLMHESVCKLHLEFFDTYMRKTKDRPEFTNNEAVTFTEYEPDVIR